MDMIDKLMLRWQFDGFTHEYQDQCYPTMIHEFAAAWKYKRNRNFIQTIIGRFDNVRPDLQLWERMGLLCKGWFYDWHEYDGRRKTGTIMSHGPSLERLMSE